MPEEPEPHKPRTKEEWKAEFDSVKDWDKYLEKREIELKKDVEECE